MNDELTLAQQQNVDDAALLDYQEPKMRGTLAIPEPDTDNDLIQVREQFAVTDFKSASWVANKIKAARNYGKAVMDWAKSEAKKADAAEEFYLNFYGPGLRAVTEEATKDTKKKSLNLPGVRLQLRAAPVTLNVADEVETMDWALRNLPHAAPIVFTVQVNAAHISFIRSLEMFCEKSGMGEYMNVQQSLIKSQLNEHFKATGEVPTGCEVVGGEERFYVQ